MLFDEILGQEHLKQMIQSAIDKNSFPQSNIIVDKDQYGGLHFAHVAVKLLFDGAVVVSLWVQVKLTVFFTGRIV